MIHKIVQSLMEFIVRKEIKFFKIQRYDALMLARKGGRMRCGTLDPTLYAEIDGVLEGYT